MENKRVLITGGAGFVGSHLADSLIGQGFHVTVVDNFVTGNKDNVEQLNGNEHFELIEADASQMPREYLGDRTFDYIFHLASPASPKGYAENPIMTYMVNGLGTHRLLEYAREVGAKFLYTSTSEAYGDPQVHPQTEDYWGNVNPIGVRACYDVSKRFGEMACITAFREFDQNVRWVRIFNTYGPRNDPYDGRVIPSFVMQALKGEPMTVFGDGSHTRSYCYVSDLVRGLEKMMWSDEVVGQVVNLGNPGEFSIQETAELIKKLTSSESEIKFLPMEGVRSEDPKVRKPDIAKAKSILGWEPEVNFEDGLKPTIEYFKRFV